MRGPWWEVPAGLARPELASSPDTEGQMDGVLAGGGRRCRGRTRGRECPWPRAWPEWDLCESGVGAALGPCCPWELPEACSEAQGGLSLK